MNNTDLDIEFSGMILTMLDLFKGSVSLEFLLNTDLPKVKSFVQGQLLNMKRNRETMSSMENRVRKELGM